MIPTKQTTLHDPDNGVIGNCLSAVLASLLHLPIDKVPVFYSETWMKDLNTWLQQFGLAYCLIDGFDAYIDAYAIKGLWHEIYGNTIRSADVLHACVAKDGEFIFDPHPDDTGLKNVVGYGFFIVLEPWRHIEEFHALKAQIREQQDVIDHQKIKLLSCRSSLRINLDDYERVLLNRVVCHRAVVEEEANRLSGLIDYIDKM